MKKTLTSNEIATLLYEDNNGGWSRAGAYALAQYLQDLEEEIGEEMELDVVAIRCDFSEYPSLQAWAEEYLPDYEDVLGLTDYSTDEDRDDCIREYILDHGQLVEFSGGVIVSSF
jgi:hypothetical protein